MAGVGFVEHSGADASAGLGEPRAFKGGEHGHLEVGVTDDGKSPLLEEFPDELSVKGQHQTFPAAWLRPLSRAFSGRDRCALPWVAAEQFEPKAARALRAKKFQSELRRKALKSLKTGKELERKGP